MRDPRGAATKAMSVLTGAPHDRPAIAQSFASPARLVVVSLCAAWCDACEEFHVVYERIAQARGAIAFVWLDIEDDAALAGDIDVENFPTLAIYRGREPVFFGVSLPHETTVLRLIDALAAAPDRMREVPEAVARLPDAFVAS